MKITLIILLFITGCTRITNYEKRDLTKMPVEYVFPIKRDSLFNLLETVFENRYTEDDHKIKRKIIQELPIEKRLSISSLSTKKGELGYGKRTVKELNSLLSNYISNKENAKIDSISQFCQDIFLFGDCVPFYIEDEELDSVSISHFVGLSRNYQFSKNKVSPYYKAIFHLVIDSIDNTHTRVKIETISPVIFVGKQLQMGGHTLPPDFYWESVAVPVEPSTLEEYEILLKIGELTGIKNEMPPLVLPEMKN